MKHLLVIILLLSTSVIYGQASQCKGVKKDSTRCKITAVNSDGYCRFHDPKAKHCAFIKKDKKQCGMIVGKDETYCRYHLDGKVQKVN